MNCSEAVTEFYEVSKRFCEQIDKVRTYDEKNIGNLLKVLSELYLKALYLPDYNTIEPMERAEMRKLLDDAEREENAEGGHKHNQGLEFGKFKYYSECFNPYEDTEAVTACLVDDLADIHTEIEIGLILYERGYEEGAVWEWGFSFACHWGEHITGAIRALDSIYRRALLEDIN